MKITDVDCESKQVTIDGKVYSDGEAYEYFMHYPIGTSEGPEVTVSTSNLFKLNELCLRLGKDKELMARLK